jgi:hypothetical protein
MSCRCSVLQSQFPAHNFQYLFLVFEQFFVELTSREIPQKNIFATGSDWIYFTKMWIFFLANQKEDQANRRRHEVMQRREASPPRQPNQTEMYDHNQVSQQLREERRKEYNDYLVSDARVCLSVTCVWL